jgi:hypothetical protein
VGSRKYPAVSGGDRERSQARQRRLPGAAGRR